MKLFFLELPGCQIITFLKFMQIFFTFSFITKVGYDRVGTCPHRAEGQ